MSRAPVAANAFRYWVFTPVVSLTPLSVDFILGNYADLHRGRISHPLGSHCSLP
jgi:hypothetical protein